MSIILTSPQTHALAPAQPEVKFTNEPGQPPLPMAAPKSASASETTGIGGGNANEMIRDPKGGAIGRRHEQLKIEPEAEAREVHDIGKDTLANVGEDEDDGRRRETPPTSALQRSSPKVAIANPEEHARQEFDERVHRRRCASCSRDTLPLRTR